jgi:hypothetical protein
VDRPAHSFDEADGGRVARLGVRAIPTVLPLAARTRRARHGLVPQQVWSFRYRPFGVWTVCYHHNG